MEFRDVEKCYLAVTAEELIKKMNDNKSALHMRTNAVDFLLDGDDEVQIQVLITRDKNDFIKDFEMEVKNY